MLAALEKLPRKWRELFEVLPEGAPAPRASHREPFTCPTCGRVFFNVASCITCEGGWAFVPGRGVAVRTGTTLGPEEMGPLLERR